jgi:hypothetical protein
MSKSISVCKIHSTSKMTTLDWPAIYQLAHIAVFKKFSHFFNALVSQVYGSGLRKIINRLVIVSYGCNQIKLYIIILSLL